MHSIRHSNRYNAKNRLFKHDTPQSAKRGQKTWIPSRCTKTKLDDNTILTLNDADRLSKNRPVIFKAQHFHCLVQGKES